ncbi:MAG: zinc transporter ZntB [Alphaproteobacteria bacterium]
MTETALPDIFVYTLRAHSDGTAAAITPNCDLGTGPDGTYDWVHLHHTLGADNPWLRDRGGLDPLVVQALLAPETRPRCTAYGDGAIVNLRGVNLNPGADPEDMVSIRLWIDTRKIISVRVRKLIAVEDIRTALETGRGPQSTGAFVTELATRLTARMETQIVSMAEQLDDLEEMMLAPGQDPTPAEIADVRRTAIILRRFIAPQREALDRLIASDLAFMGERDRVLMRETGDRVTRIVEELEAARERATVLADQLRDRQAAQLNKHMFMLSIAAAVFLPLTFITGLLGMNVGGLPWANNTSGFTIVSTLCFSMIAVLLAVFRRLRWL